ncbi:MAG: hypothetical protein FK733_16425 [Asgard group archaeon]|nr:hypothetical protein [Asgard group archaeon]
MKIPGSFLTNPVPLEIHDENNDKKKIALTFSKPINDQINLIVVGKVSDAVLERINMDLSAGIAMGFLNRMNEINQKEPESIFVKSFFYQEYGYAYKEIIEYGIGISIIIMDQQYMREAIASVVDVDSIEWAVKEKTAIVRAKEEDYKQDIAITFYEKETDENWAVPWQAVKIWQNLLYNDSNTGEELVKDLAKAFKKNKGKDIEEISTKIEKLLVKG